MQSLNGWMGRCCAAALCVWVLGIVGCGDDGADTAQDASQEDQASVEAEAMGAACGEDTDCPGELVCDVLLGCIDPTCDDVGRGESVGCPTNGYCKQIDGSLIGCLRMCEDSSECQNQSAELTCESGDDFSQIVGFKFCALHEN